MDFVKELRLGNWLYGHDPASMIHNYEGYFQVESLEENRVNAWRVDGFGDESAYKSTPIPLTPELLQNIGFASKYKSVGYNFYLNGVNLTSQDEGDDGLPIPNYVFHVYYNHFGKGVYFVHQLQNLYFALVGEELNINL